MNWGCIVMQSVKNEPVPLKMPNGLSTVTLHVYAFFVNCCVFILPWKVKKLAKTNPKIIGKMFLRSGSRA